MCMTKPKMLSYLRKDLVGGGGEIVLGSWGMVWIRSMPTQVFMIIKNISFCVAKPAPAKNIKDLTWEILY